MNLKAALLATLIAIPLLVPAARAEVICHQSGAYTRCWDTMTGRTVSTTEHGSGGYSYTWDQNGHAWTTLDANGTTHTWQTR